MFNYLAIFALLLGLTIGSFLNVIIFRIDDLRTVLYDRSHCPSCKTVLKWYDLVPFLSFVMLRAKCRYCGKPISWQYPIVEICVGLLFFILFLFFGLSWAFGFYALIFSILTVVLVYDVRTKTVPEIFVWVALIISAIFGWYIGGFTISQALIGALIGGGFLALLVFISKEKWMGMGDIKIGLILGFLVGYPQALFGLFTAFVLGSLYGLVLMYFKKTDLKSSVAFAPFVILATLLAVIYGTTVTNWYLGITGYR